MTPVLKAVVAVACGYEALSIVTGRAPTISMLCGRRRWLAPLIVGGLVVHLYRYPKGNT